MDLTSKPGGGVEKNRKLPTSKTEKKPLKQAEKQCYIPKCQKLAGFPDFRDFSEEKKQRDNIKITFAAAEIAGIEAAVQRNAEET